nr:MAG TPA: hypothetical protein [Caudoviricetes sp.]
MKIARRLLQGQDGLFFMGIIELQQCSLFDFIIEFRAS